MRGSLASRNGVAGRLVANAVRAARQRAAARLSDTRGGEVRLRRLNVAHWTSPERGAM
jgi:precorrin-6B methylase 2